MRQCAWVTAGAALVFPTDGPPAVPLGLFALAVGFLDRNDLKSSPPKSASQATACSLLVTTGKILPVTAIRRISAERAFVASVADKTMPAPLRQRVTTGKILPVTAMQTFRGDVKFDRALREMRPAIEAALSRADKEISEGGGAATTKPKRKWDADAFDARFAHLAVGMELFGF